jgi:hypothetical protein
MGNRLLAFSLVSILTVAFPDRGSTQDGMDRNAAETRQQWFHRLLRKFGREKDGRRSLQLMHAMALTSGQPEGPLVRGSSDSRLAAQHEYLEKAVRQHLSRKDIPLLVSLAEKAPHVPARNYAIQFLIWMDAKPALPALRRLTKDREETVRRNAARAVEALTTSGG